MFNVTRKVTTKQVAYLLCAGFEGGCGYWCRIVDYREPAPGPAPDPGLSKLDQSYAVWPVQGGAVICRDHTAEDETDEAYKPLVLDGEAVQRGLQILAEKYPHHWAAFIDENYDATTGDAFIQCALLGDVIYG